MMATHKKVSSVAAAPAPADAAAPAEALAAPVATGEALPADNPLPESHQALAADDVPAEALAAPVYPIQVTLRNNGGFAVAEPVSGAFLQAGGSQTVWLHDEAHASRVLDNLRELAERNHLVGALVADGFPKSTIQENEVKS